METIEVQATFNKNEINKAITDVKKQIEEVEGILDGIVRDKSEVNSQSEKKLVDKDLPKSLEGLMERLEMLVGYRDDLVHQVKDRYDGIGANLKVLIASIDSYVKPKVKSISSK